MESPGALIAARLRAWGSPDLPVERAVFGTAEPEQLAAAVDAFVLEALGARIERYEFFESSSGSVHGVVLNDGRSVVVKGHRATVSRGYLDAVVEVQSALADSGYPAPRPLAGPVPVGAGHVTAETMLDRAGDVDGHDAEVRKTIASGLAQFIRMSRPYRRNLTAAAHPMNVADGSLYPTPHSPRFDFAATAAGAEWIDDLAGRARARLSAVESPYTVVHGDWRIENLCVRAGQLTAVYDWDSVQIAREVGAVATAATTFSVDWRRPPSNFFPRPDEIADFIAEYDAARGGPFTDEEHDALAASIVASLAYGARCEHADPAWSPTHDDCQRGLLATLGETLLATGLVALR